MDPRSSKNVHGSLAWVQEDSITRNPRPQTLNHRRSLADWMRVDTKIEVFVGSFEAHFIRIPNQICFALAELSYNQ